MLRPSPESLLHYKRSLGLRSDRSALTALAAAIGSSLVGSSGVEAQILVRTGPEPALGVLTESSDLEAQDLEAQAHSLDTALKRLRYIGYRNAEQAVRSLASELIGRFGNDQLRRCRFTAIPRGGLTVLGLLASALDLPPSQTGGPGGGEPLVVVDDCALTGARFGAFLAGCTAERIVFAHLASHPSLRAVIEAREPRVLACMAALDLAEHSPESSGSAYAEAQARWQERLGPARYWIGDCDHICFPWNEPDRLIWNPVRETVEVGWRLVPPRLCLKNANTAGHRPAVQVQPRGRGPLVPSRQALFGRWGRDTVVARLDTAEVFRLAGSAAAMWWALLRGGDLAPALSLLRARFQVGDEALASDLSRFVETLLAQGLFERELS